MTTAKFENTKELNEFLISLEKKYERINKIEYNRIIAENDESACRVFLENENKWIRGQMKGYSIQHGYVELQCKSQQLGDEVIEYNGLKFHFNCVFFHNHKKYFVFWFSGSSGSAYAMDIQGNGYIIPYMKGGQIGAPQQSSYAISDSIQKYNDNDNDYAAIFHFTII